VRSVPWKKNKKHGETHNDYGDSYGEEINHDGQTNREHEGLFELSLAARNFSLKKAGRQKKAGYDQLISQKFS
jgi:hypothetical protein